MQLQLHASETRTQGSRQQQGEGETGTVLEGREVQGVGQADSGDLNAATGSSSQQTEGAMISRRGKGAAPPLLQLQGGGSEFVLAECSGAAEQQQQGVNASSGQLLRRTNWRFYWTWAKRLLLVRAIMCIFDTG